MKCEKCGCEDPKDCESGAAMSGNTKAKAKSGKGPAAKKAAKRH